MIGGAAAHGLFATVNQVGCGPGVCQPRVVAHAASEHTRSTEIVWDYLHGTKNNIRYSPGENTEGK